MKSSEDIKLLSEARTGMARLIKQIQTTKRPLVITQHGKSVAVLLDVHEFEAIQEKLELFTDIQTALTQIEDGQGVSHIDVKRQILS